MGARLVAGGTPVEGAGYFFTPTVLADVTEEMPVMREETFGPVAAVMAAADEDEAVALANRTEFGLGANLWTRDLERARRLVPRLEAGSVFINGMVASTPSLPFGGVKRSGFGRELSRFGIREFTNIQTVWMGPRRTVAMPTAE
jgi:succinate-semialdehyde dehydrogenase/glutarate-semialdehyde dehydrogenase